MIDRPLWYILNEHGDPEPADTETAGHWFANIRNRVVLHDDIGRVFVSTVFLSLDHQYGDGPPVLWETMIFHHPVFKDSQWRYTSKSAAIAGHLRALDLIHAYARSPRRTRKAIRKVETGARLGPDERRRVARWYCRLAPEADA